MNYIVKKDNMITMIRGDSFKHLFRFETGRFPRKKRIVLNDGDLIYFGLMYPEDYFEHCIFKKEFTKEDFNSEGDFILRLEPEDTVWLKPGTYYYEIKILHESSEDVHLHTLIQKTRFIILD